MFNEIVFFTHVIGITITILFVLKLGKEALISLLCLQGILANLFVVKQISLFSFHVTASDVFAVGGIFTLNLLQEYFGKQYARKAILINFILILFYLGMTQFHIAYSPSVFDTMHSHYHYIFQFMPRLITASIATYLIVQLTDTYLYQFLQTIFNGRNFALRSFISVSCSQFLDTILFSFLGLYGIVASITDIILVSFIIKMITISLVSSFIALTKKFSLPK